MFRSSICWPNQIAFSVDQTPFGSTRELSPGSASAGARELCAQRPEIGFVLLRRAASAGEAPQVERWGAVAGSDDG